MIGALLAIGHYLYRTMAPRVAILGRHEDGTLRDVDEPGLSAFPRRPNPSATVGAIDTAGRRDRETGPQVSDPGDVRDGRHAERANRRASCRTAGSADAARILIPAPGVRIPAPDRSCYRSTIFRRALTFSNLILFSRASHPSAIWSSSYGQLSALMSSAGVAAFFRRSCSYTLPAVSPIFPQSIRSPHPARAAPAAARRRNDTTSGGRNGVFWGRTTISRWGGYG